MVHSAHVHPAFLLRLPRLAEPELVAAGDPDVVILLLAPEGQRLSREIVHVGGGGGAVQGRSAVFGGIEALPHQLLHLFPGHVQAEGAVFALIVSHDALLSSDGKGGNVPGTLPPDPLFSWFSRW